MPISPLVIHHSIPIPFFPEAEGPDGADRAVPEALPPGGAGVHLRLEPAHPGRLLHAAEAAGRGVHGRRGRHPGGAVPARQGRHDRPLREQLHRLRRLQEVLQGRGHGL